MPNTESELRKYSRNTNYNFLNEILEKLEPTEMTINLPKFRFECTSRAEKALGKVCITVISYVLIVHISFTLAWNHDTLYIES